MTLGLHDLARDCLARSGVPVNTLGTEEMLTRAMHGTTDFPALLTESGNRVLAGACRRAESPLKTIARQRTATDFRPPSVLELGEFSGLKKVSEAGEIKARTVGEAKQGHALETFGGTFALSRKALVNDGLGAFGRWSEMMGRAAAETEAAQLLGLLTQASGAGPVMGEDGVRLFHATHGNLAATGAAPDETTLTAARLALRTMKGLDGKTPISATPRYILVGPELETAVEKLLASIYATTTSDVNPHAGKLSLLVEPRITGKAWWLFADPAVMPVLEYAYLSSAPGPQLASRDGWETLGHEFRVVPDLAAVPPTGAAHAVTRRVTAMATLADMIQMRDTLLRARSSGAREIRDQNGEVLIYNGDAEMARALAALDSEIAAAQRRPSNTIRFRTSKGLHR